MAISSDPLTNPYLANGALDYDRLGVRVDPDTGRLCRWVEVNDGPPRQIGNKFIFPIKRIKRFVAPLGMSREQAAIEMLDWYDPAFPDSHAPGASRYGPEVQRGTWLRGGRKPERERPENTGAMEGEVSTSYEVVDAPESGAFAPREP